MITGKQIRQAREALGENYQRFAERVGVHRTTIMRWELHGIPLRASAQALARQVLSQLERAA